MNMVTSELATNGLLEIVFDRPEAKNAFTNLMYDQFTEVLRSAATDSQVGCVLIRGAPGAFSAGNDLAEFIAEPPLGSDAPVLKMLSELAAFRKVLIAAVDGVAIGIGSTMLLHCDLVVASERSRFGFPFVNLGIVPEAASSFLLPRLVGRQRALELLLLGDHVDAATAHRLGFVNRVLEGEGVLPEARALAVRILEKPPQVLQTLKSLAIVDYDAVVARMSEENLLLAERIVSPEAIEAISAIREKRKPVFTR